MSGSRLREIIDRMTKKLQRGFCEDLCNAAGRVQQPFANAPKAVGRSVSLIVGYARHDKSAKPGSSTAHLANQDQRKSRARATSNSGNAPQVTTHRSSEPTLPAAMDPRTCPGRY